MQFLSVVACLSAAFIVGALGSSLRYLPARGCVNCEGSGFRVKISNTDAIAWAVSASSYNDPNLYFAGFWVGNESDPACRSQASGSQKTSHELIAPFESCNIVRTSHPNGTIEYASQARLKVLYGRGNAGVPVYFAMNVSCVWYPNGYYALEQDSADVVNLLPGVFGELDITMSSDARWYEKPFGIIANANVQTVKLTFELDVPFRDQFIIGFDRCWAALDDNRTSDPQANYINPVGCPREAGKLVIISELENPWQLEAEMAALEFEGYPINGQKLFFHCLIKVCDKNDPVACQPSNCGTKGRNDINQLEHKFGELWAQQKGVAVNSEAAYFYYENGKIMMKTIPEPTHIPTIPPKPTADSNNGSVKLGVLGWMSVIVLLFASLF